MQALAKTGIAFEQVEKFGRWADLRTCMEYSAAGVARRTKRFGDHVRTLRQRGGWPSSRYSYQRLLDAA